MKSFKFILKNDGTILFFKKYNQSNFIAVLTKKKICIQQLNLAMLSPITAKRVLYS